MIYKMSAVLNSHLNLPPKRLRRDAEYIGRLCHSFERLCCLHIQGGILLENVDSMFLYEVFMPMYQITWRQISNDCIVNIN